MSDSPLQHTGRNAMAGESPLHGDPMNIGCVVSREVGPETSVFELELDGSSRFTIKIGKME
jgi:hypothetical protein